MSPKTILENYQFDVETGVFTRKGALPGKGIVEAGNGYIRIFLCGRYYPAHHIAWLLCHGCFPSLQIDHINGDRADNRSSNLREVTAVENSQNQRRPHSTSSTGLLGASPIRQTGMVSERWRAQIKVNGRSIHLGSFGSPADAHQAYINAKRRLHPGCTI